MFLHLLYILSISKTSISNSLGNIFDCGCDAVASHLISHPRCGFYFRSLSSSFRRMSCACTHRKILPAITPRNAGGISPRARPRGNPILLSFSAMRKKVSKERIADTALSASSCSIPIVLTLILYFLLASLTIWLFHHHILC